MYIHVVVCIHVGVEITVEEAIEKMGFGPFQVLVCFFAGMLWVRVCMSEATKT